VPCYAPFVPHQIATKALLCLGLSAFAVPTSAAEIPILPFDEVRAGMRGTGRTVFEGTRIESFDVEILGTLPRIGPEQNLILGRCSGGPLERTGVLAGMSGSPVFVDGKLVGAIAYNWGFSKDAVAGITPIEEMLAVARRAEARGARALGGPRIEDNPADVLRSSARLAAFFSRDLPGRIAAPASALPYTLPISVAGIGPEGLSQVLPDLRRAGFLPVQGGGAGSRPEPSPALEPGSAVGLKLVRGDIEMTATGTVTWVDAERVLAFGHPLFGLGTVELPMSGARVEALIPSLERSLRLATPLSEVGSLVEDRNAGVLGKVGGAARMIPVRLELSIAGREKKAFSFDLASDPLLAPLFLYDSLNGILTSAGRAYGNITLRLREGSVIKMDGQDDIELNNLFAGSTAPYFATGTSAFLLYLVMNNDLTPPRVGGVNLILEYQDEPLSAHVRRVTLDRSRARPGEDVEATVILSPFRGDDIVLTRKIHLPLDTPPGPLVFNVGDADAVTRTEAGDAPMIPRDLSQLISLINRIPRNDRVYILASRDDAGVFLSGRRLPNLPASVQAVLTRPRNRGNFALISHRNVLEEQIPVDYAVDGFARVQLEVELP